MKYKSGPRLILAGPGTGKTTRLIQNIIELIKATTQKEHGIIVCTFTRKATEELKRRLLEKITISELNKINFLIGTIHSICFELLARYSKYDFGDYQIIPEDAQTHFIHSKLHNLGFTADKIKKDGWLLAEDMSKVYNKITDEQIDLTKIKHKYEDIEYICDSYRLYKRILNRNKLFDFATIQETLVEQLEKDTDLITRIKKDYKYIFVDEYQDVNNIQNLIFNKLTAPTYNLTVVGDDDQSIYGFRGAKVKFIHNYEAYYMSQGVSCKQEYLTTNYRSTKSIVDYSNQILENTKYERLEKKIKANRGKEAHKPIVKVFDKDYDEVDYICRKIRRFKKTGIIKYYNQVGILFKSVKSDNQLLCRRLDEYEIPYKLIGAGNFFTEAFGLEFLAILDYFLAKYIEKEQIFYDEIARIDIEKCVDLTSQYTENEYIDNLENIFTKKKYYSNIELAYDILIGAEFFKRYAKEGENIGELTSIILSFDDFVDYFGDGYDLSSFLKYLNRNKKVDYKSKDEGVNLMTIHQAKGLEFPVVFMPYQIKKKKINNILTKFNSLVNIKEVDEELRVFYVGATRSEDLLFVTASKTCHNRVKIYESTKMFNLTKNIKYTASDLDINIVKQQKFRKYNKEDHEPMVLSYNKIHSYRICPKQYMYAHDWKLQTIRIGGMEYGSNVHKILETIIRNIIDGEQIEEINIDEIIDRNWRNKNFRNDEENDKFKKIATEQIYRFIEKQENILKKKNIHSVEESFNLLINNNLITGRFDAVFQNNKTKLIIDYKTGDDRDYTEQMSFYSLCFKEKYPQEDVQLAIYFLKTGELRYLQPNNKADEIAKMEKISDKIIAQDYNATPGLHCRDCAYNLICEDRIR